jgi:hypothetical protein
MAQFPPEVRAGLVRLRLIENVLTGDDRAVQSCKLLGQDRALGLWEPDTVVGIQVTLNSTPYPPSDPLPVLPEELPDESED